MKTRVHIQLLALGEPMPTVQLPNGVVATRGTSLRQWIERNNGVIAERPNPFARGETLTVDLSPYIHLDPDATFLRISYEGIDPAKVGTKLPDG